MKVINEMPRGQQKKLPKYKAAEIAKEQLIDSLSVAYYKFESDDYFQSLSDEEQELIMDYMQAFGDKMAKSIGKKFYTQ